jgi:2-desacetyl-2-hydroxyethyl bacteriochlorophyllide A dehydrogenase
MKALVYTAEHTTEYRDEPDPVCEDGEVLIQVEAVGICGSDMHAWHGHDPRRVPPLILGHEACGIVVGGPTTGTRVVVNPLITCGECAFCQSGRANLCATRELIGMRLPGAFAEHVVLPARNLIEVPDGMEPVVAALTEPCATAWHALTLALRALWRPLAECRALVIGGGSVGLLGALILKAWGARDIRLAETNQLRLETAIAAGVDAFDPRATPAEEDAYELVLDAVGSVGTRASATFAVNPGGVIAHVGLQEWAGNFDARTLTLQEITLVGVYTYTDCDLRASLNALHAGRLGSLQWLEQRPLSDGAAAFNDLDANQTRAAKIILQP